MRILFGVQGTGNGHISRCRTLATALKQTGAEVDYIFSGRAPEDYFDMQVFGQYRTFRGVSFATKNGKINLRKTIQRIRAFRLIKDVKELDLSDYDCIISDFEPVSAWAAHHQQLDCLGISNQSACSYLHPKQYGLIAKVIMKFYAPVTRPIGLHWFHFGYPILPPMIDPLENKGENGKIVVYLPFESLQDIQTLLSNFPEQQFVCFHPDIKNKTETQSIQYSPLGRDTFTNAVASCSGIITNTGFALISEALVLGKKILTKPLSGQFEQLYNADCLEQLDMAKVMHSLDSNTVRDWLKLPSQSPIIYPNVAEELAKWIVSGQKEELSQLSQRLWQQVNFPEHISKRVQALGFSVNNQKIKSE